MEIGRGRRDEVCPSPLSAPGLETDPPSHDSHHKAGEIRSGQGKWESHLPHGSPPGLRLGTRLKVVQGQRERAVQPGSGSDAVPVGKP